MAVLIQFTTLLVRIDRLMAVTSDGVVDIMRGWPQYWRDQHLVAVPFMDMGAAELAAELERWGLTLRDTSSGTTTWKDICVVDYYDGPTNPCPWLEYDPEEHIAWLKGTPQGRVAGPEHRHEDAPIRVTPDKLHDLMRRQYPAPAQEPSVALALSHEARLLPLTQGLAAELLKSIPTSAKLEAIVFMAQFPRRGQEVHAGLILHELAGERRAFSLAHTTDEARALLRQISRYDSEEPLTSLEIKIAGDGTTSTRFGGAPPLDADGLAAYMDRIYGAIPRARPATLPAVGCIPGLFRAIFGPKLKLYPLPRLQHRPQRESLSLLLDTFRGIDEGWDRPIDPSSVPTPAERAAAAELLARLQKLAAQREAGEPASDDHLVIPEAEGVLFAEARQYHRVFAAELQRARPELRFDPINERFTRDLGPDLGELRYVLWRGEVVGVNLDVDGLPSFGALMARLPPVLAALGGMGPLADAFLKTHPAMLREVTPMYIGKLRTYLVPTSLYGHQVYMSWLLGAPHYTKVGLEFGVAVIDDRLSYSYAVRISEV